MVLNPIKETMEKMSDNISFSCFWVQQNMFCMIYISSLKICMTYKYNFISVVKYSNTFFIKKEYVFFMLDFAQVYGL